MDYGGKTRVVVDSFLPAKGDVLEEIKPYREKSWKRMRMLTVVVVYLRLRVCMNEVSKNLKKVINILWLAYKYFHIHPCFLVFWEEIMRISARTNLFFLLQLKNCVREDEKEKQKVKYCNMKDEIVQRNSFPILHDSLAYCLVEQWPSL